ncbi:hypothetical protein BDZ97DRAFT_2056338 [Flammula alnicola]|nr:hypothetical protein BDZ97DRAFT_2056338 [Flammula alnicola]
MVPAPAHSSPLPPALLRDVSTVNCLHWMLKFGLKAGTGRTADGGRLFMAIVTGFTLSDLDNVRRRSEISAPKNTKVFGHKQSNPISTEIKIQSAEFAAVTGYRRIDADLKSANVAQAALGRNQLQPLGVQIVADPTRSLRTIADMYRLLQSWYSLGMSPCLLDDGKRKLSLTASCTIVFELVEIGVARACRSAQAWHASARCPPSRN